MGRPLVEMTTNLKSLRFGKDTVGGGNSNQPFVVRDIPEDLSDVGRTGGPDFLLRGGSLLPRIAVNDTLRISKLFFPTQRTVRRVDDASDNARTPINLIGTLFTAKQNILSLTNVNSGAGYEDFEEAEGGTGVGDFLRNNVALNQGIYTPLSTIAQTAGNALGVHLIKQGLNPNTETTIGSPDGNTSLGLPTYLNTIAAKEVEGENTTEDNRLLRKSRLKVLAKRKIDKNTGADLNLYSYSGGPGGPGSTAILGVGKTNINMVSEYRTGLNNPQILLSKSGPIYGTGSVITGFKDVPEFTSVISGGNEFKFSRTRTVAEREAVDTISYIKPKPNQSPTVNDTDESLQNKIKNDKLFRVGASAAFYSNANIFSSGTITSDYFIPPFFEQFNADGTIIRNNIYDTIADPYSLKTDPNNEAFKSGINRNIERQVFTQQEIENKLPFSKTNNPDNIKDFRKVVAPNGSNMIPDTLPYTSANKFEQRVNLGNPGANKKNRKSYTIGRRDQGAGTDRDTVKGNSLYTQALDQVNALPIYKSGNVTSDAVKNDFVKFRIGIIDNNNPSEKTYIHFRAIINSMTDNYSANWNEIKYMGRGEQFFKYDGFDRTISLGWTVAAQSKQELIPMYQKLNYLASSLAPNYSDEGYMRGNLATLTIGGWCYEQPGIIQGINLEVPQDSPWEISIPDASNPSTSVDGANLLTDPSVKEVPMIINVSGFNFKPIHNFIPQLQTNTFNGRSLKGGGKFVSKYGNERFIALANEGGVNNYSGGTTGKEKNEHINYIPSK